MYNLHICHFHWIVSMGKEFWFGSASEHGVHMGQCFFAHTHLEIKSNLY
jgi:hypothetical protein